MKTAVAKAITNTAAASLLSKSYIAKLERFFAPYPLDLMESAVSTEFSRDQENIIDVIFMPCLTFSAALPSVTSQPMPFCALDISAIFPLKSGTNRITMVIISDIDGIIFPNIYVNLSPVIIFVKHENHRSMEDIMIPVQMPYSAASIVIRLYSV